MLNLIRMNNYRVRHMTCMYVLVIIICLFAVFSVSTISAAVEEMASDEYEEYDGMVDAMIAGYNDAAIEDGNEEAVIKIGIDAEENGDAYKEGYELGQEVSMNFGIVSNQPIQPDGTVSSYLAYYYEDISSGLLLMFLTIAVVLFYNREQNSGFIKNISSKLTSRTSIFFSKFVTMGIYMLVIMLITAVSEYFALWIYYDGNLTFGINVLDDFVPKFCVQLLLHIAFLSGVIMVTTVTKSSTMGITIGILAITGFSDFIVLIIKVLLDVDISKYLIRCNIASVNLNSGSDVVNHALLVGIITIIVYNVIGCTWFAKRDIA